MKNHPLLALLMLFTLVVPSLQAQDNVGIGTLTPDPSAVLELESTDKGILIPRVTTSQRQAIPTPAEGLMVYDTDFQQFWYFDGTQWVQAIGPQGPAGPAGANGVAGATGAQGITGPQGLIGPTGAQGIAGPAGVQGLIGPTGVQGAAGPAGANGAAGAPGVQGPVGPQGPAGSNGAQGSQGPAGPQGAQGPQGPAGFANSNSFVYTTTAPLTQAYPSGSTISYLSLPNLSHNFTVPSGANYKVFVTAMGSASKTNSDGSRSFIQYEIFLDGVGTGAYQRVSMDDEENSQFAEVPWSISYIVSVPPGNHTIQIRGAHAGGDCSSGGIFGGSDCPGVVLCWTNGFVGQANMNVFVLE